MAPPIRIGPLEPDEAADLIGALVVRGLVGRAVAADGGRWVEIHDPHEETERLVGDVRCALETWLADRGRGSVPFQVGERTETATVSADLPGALQARLGSTARQPSSQS